MSNHPTELALPDGATIEQAAAAIAGLRYDALAAFFDALAEKIVLDAGADAADGRPQLAERLQQLAHRVAWCARDTEDVWRLCASHENTPTIAPRRPAP